jgi:hypothetical protein
VPPRRIGRVRCGWIFRAKGAAEGRLLNLWFLRRP